MNTTNRQPSSGASSPASSGRGGTGQVIVSMTGQRVDLLLPVHKDALPNNGVYKNLDTLRELFNTWTSDIQPVPRCVRFFGNTAGLVAEVWFSGGRFVAATYFDEQSPLYGEAALLELSRRNPDGRYEGWAPVEPPAGRDDFMEPFAAKGALAFRPLSGVEVVGNLQKARDEESLKAAEEDARRQAAVQRDASEIDRSGGYSSATYFMQRLVDFWVKETAEKNNDGIIGVRRVDVSERGARLGSIWFERGHIIGARCLIPGAQADGYEGLLNLVPRLTRGNYDAVCHTNPPHPDLTRDFFVQTDKGPKPLGTNTIFLDIMSLLEKGDDAKDEPVLDLDSQGVLFVPGSVGCNLEITTSGAERPYRVIRAPARLDDAPEIREYHRVLGIQVGFPMVQDEDGGPVHFLDPQNGWKTVRTCSLEQLFRGGAMSPGAGELLRLMLRAILKKKFGAAPHLPPVSEFSPYGIVPFSVTVGGEARHGTCDLSGNVLDTFEPGSVLEFQGGFLWEKAPDGTVRHVMRDGFRAFRRSQGVVRAGGLPLWFLVDEKAAAEPDAPTFSLFRKEAPRHRTVRALDAWLRSPEALELEGDQAAAVLAPGFWDGAAPADKDLGRIRDLLLKHVWQSARDAK